MEANDKVTYDSDEWERWYLDHPEDRPDQYAHVPKCRQKSAKAKAARNERQGEWGYDEDVDEVGEQESPDPLVQKKRRRRTVKSKK